MDASDDVLAVDLGFLEVWLEDALAGDIVMATQKLPEVTGDRTFAADFTILSHSVSCSFLAGN